MEIMTRVVPGSVSIVPGITSFFSSWEGKAQPLQTECVPTHASLVLSCLNSQEPEISARKGQGAHTLEKSGTWWNSPEVFLGDPLTTPVIYL